MEVRDRHLGRRDQVQLVAGDDVHLVFLVRDLPGPARRVRVDHGRRPDLGEAVLAGVDVEEPVDERALERGRRRPCRPGSRSRRSWRRAALSRMSSASPISQCGSPRPGRAAGGRVGAGLAVERLVAGQQLAPGPDRDVGLLVADRDVRVGRVRDAQQQVVELGLDASRARRRAPSIRSPARPTSARSAATSGPPRVGAAPDGLADPLRRPRCARALSASPSARSARRARVDLERPVDERRVLALVDRALADAVGLLAQPLQADAHRAPPSALQPAAARSRPITKAGSRLASSQPARGPLVRPRKAR